MEKWEYMSIVAEDTKILQINGKPYSRGVFDSLVGIHWDIWEFINQKGQEGWEVIETKEKGGNREFLLKRRVE